MSEIFTDNPWITALAAVFIALLLWQVLPFIPAALKKWQQSRALAKLDPKQKQAVIRIWLEIIEADGSTSREETDALPKITHAQFNASRELSFDEAINVAKLMSGDARNMLLELCDTVCQSDGIVSQSEEKVLDTIKSSIPSC